MKAPNINIGEILKKLSFLKNNLGLLVPIVIAVVALLLFIPTRILSGKLRATVEQTSVRTGQQIAKLTKDIQEAAPAGSLEGYINAYIQDVNQIDAMMAQTVYRELLRYDIFRDTNETSELLFERFGQRYRSGVEAMTVALQAGLCPTDVEIRAALESAPRLSVDGTRGGAYDRNYGGSTPYRGAGQQWSLQTMTEVERGIFDEICTGKAKAAKVYASPADMAGYAYWDQWKFEDRDKAYRECWYWQLGYWIVEDVVTTIRIMNEGSQNTLVAPVKRLMNVSFQLKQTGMMISSRRSRRRKEEEYPTYVTKEADALTTPCTGRFSNDDIDVLHFEARVVVDESQVLPFIRALCSGKEHKFFGFDGKQQEQTYQHNQITVLESNITPIEPISIYHQSYRYGRNPAVELALICEYVVPKIPAYEDIKPKQVKEDLLPPDESEE